MSGLEDAYTSILVLLFLLGLYFLPTVVAFAREVSSPWSIAVVNAFLGWTVVGWVVALAMAVRTKPGTTTEAR